MDIRAAFQSIVNDMPAYRQLLVTALERAPDPTSREQLQHALQQIDHYFAQAQRTMPEALDALDKINQQTQADLAKAQGQIKIAEGQIAELAATAPPVPVAVAAAASSPSPLPPVDPRVGQTLRVELLQYFGYL